MIFQILTLVVAVRILLLISSNDPKLENSDTNTVQFCATTASEIFINPGNYEF